MGRFVATYHGPSTPGNPGFSIDLTDVSIGQGFRSGDLSGVVTEAELGAVGISSARLDDPTATAGNAGDAIVGLKQLSITELDAPSGNRRIGEFYIADRRYYRGTQGASPSLMTGPARVIDMSLSDINSFLHFRILRTGEANGSNTTFNRPAETDVERVTALLAVPFIADTLFNGLVSSDGPVNMDAVDYTGQTPGDVLNDCAQQSGKNYFVFYDESGTYTPSPGDFALFYDSNSSTAYPAAVADTQVSNVLTDLSAGGGGPVWYPLQDATLVRDPSRVISGAFFNNGSNSVYVTNPTTSYTFGWRDAVGNSQDLTTVAQTTARGNRYLAENSTEDDRLTFKLKLPAAHVNDWKEGQWAQVRFTHLPGYEAFTNVRCLCRTVASDEMTDQFYNVTYECTPMAGGTPSGATDRYVDGVAFSGIPELPAVTTPGNLLLAIVVIEGESTTIASSIGGAHFLDDPPTSGSPVVPPYSDATWTVLATAAVDAAGQNVLGPDAGHALAVAIAYRFVQPGEVTLSPVAVSGADVHFGASIWLWEIPTIVAPTGGASFDTQGAPPDVPHDYALPTQAGNVVGVLAWRFADSGSEGATVTPVSGTTVNNAQANNDPTDSVSAGWITPWVWIGQLVAGGILTANMATIPDYHNLSAAGVVAVLPAGVVLPPIPYPANQT